MDSLVSLNPRAVALEKGGWLAGWHWLDSLVCLGSKTVFWRAAGGLAVGWASTKKSWDVGKKLSTE